MPSTATVASTTNVVRYRSSSGPVSGSTGVIAAVTSPPTTASRNSRVWIRPASVGTMSVSLSTCLAALDFLAPDPLPPLAQRAERAEAPAQSSPGEVVGDLLCGDLQPQERVHTGEVATERRRAGGIYAAVAASCAPDLVRGRDIEPADRVQSRVAVLEKVVDDPVLG